MPSGKAIASMISPAVRPWVVSLPRPEFVSSFAAGDASLIRFVTLPSCNAYAEFSSAALRLLVATLAALTVAGPFPASSCHFWNCRPRRARPCATDSAARASWLRSKARVDPLERRNRNTHNLMVIEGLAMGVSVPVRIGISFLLLPQ